MRYLLEVFVKPEFDVTDETLSQIVIGWYDQGAQIPFRRGKKTKTLDVRRLLKAEGHEVLADGCVRIQLCTRCDNEGSLRPEIIVAAFDQALRGLDPGVDEEIVSTGIQQLTVFDGYNVERISQSMRVDGSTIIEPLGRELGAPEGSLLARSMR